MLYNAKNGCIKIDNTDMDYISFGKRKKNLIMIQGLGDGLQTVKGMAFPFAYMYRKFARDYTVYVFSRKNAMPDTYSTFDMANDIITVMYMLKIDNADILGVSQGGMIAQHLAINYPERVNKLVLAVTLSCQNETVRNAVSAWIEFAKNGDYKSIFIDTAEKSYSEKYLKKYRPFLSLLGTTKKAHDFNRFITMANACLTHDTFDSLDKIIAPTLVIGGDSDKIVGIKSSQEIADKINGSQLYIYKGLGHAAYEEAKDFNKRVLDFLKS